MFVNQPLQYSFSGNDYHFRATTRFVDIVNKAVRDHCNLAHWASVDQEGFSLATRGAQTQWPPKILLGYFDYEFLSLEEFGFMGDLCMSNFGVLFREPTGFCTRSGKPGSERCAREVSKVLMFDGFRQDSHSTLHPTTPVTSHVTFHHIIDIPHHTTPTIHITSLTYFILSRSHHT